MLAAVTNTMRVGKKKKKVSFDQVYNGHFKWYTCLGVIALLKVWSHTKKFDMIENDRHHERDLVRMIDVLYLSPATVLFQELGENRGRHGDGAIFKNTRVDVLHVDIFRLSFIVFASGNVYWMNQPRRRCIYF